MNTNQRTDCRGQARHSPIVFTHPCLSVSDWIANLSTHWVINKLGNTNTVDTISGIFHIPLRWCSRPRRSPFLADHDGGRSPFISDI
jgi:hypothetical protein